VLTGLPVERTDASITIADAKGDKQTIATSDIEEFYDSPISLMPENLYLQFQPQQLRDLFAYIQLAK
jgi:putative heme-binding domain-containing protein